MQHSSTLNMEIITNTSKECKRRVYNVYRSLAEEKDC